MRLLLISFIMISSFVRSEPWIGDNVKEFNLIKKNIFVICNNNLNYLNSYPLSYADIYKSIINIKKNSSSIECKNYLSNLIKDINKKFLSPQTHIGFQTKIDEYYLQESGYRYLNDKNLFFTHTDVHNNFSYKFNIIRNSNKTYFDESYFSFLIKDNYSLKIGKYSRWWSPSDDTSLILSNSARPFPSVSISSYKPIDIDNSFITFFEDFDISFEVFLGKLERNREIPNAMVFGNRLSLDINNYLRISLLRVAQFGGKGRIINSQTIKKMILGQDTTNSRMSFEEQPGNQIAGIDFSMSFPSSNNISIYGQYLGEDGLDPIIDDRWIGAIFPSKRFGLVGLSFFINEPDLIKLTLEHVNTDSGYKNVTYNHNLYKTGYRYKGMPLGASIDTDSHKTFISLKKTNSKSELQLKFQKMKINQNKSIYTRWGNANFDNEEFVIKYSYFFNEKLSIELNGTYRNFNVSTIDNDKIIFLKIKQSI